MNGGTPRDISSAAPRVAGLTLPDAPFPETVRALLGRLGVGDPVSIARGVLTRANGFAEDARNVVLRPILSAITVGSIAADGVNPVRDAFDVLRCLGVRGLGGQLLALTAGARQSVVDVAALGANLA